jgi:hypothetical protein
VTVMERESTLSQADLAKVYQTNAEQIDKL